MRLGRAVALATRTATSCRSCLWALLALFFSSVPDPATQLDERSENLLLGDWDRDELDEELSLGALSSEIGEGDRSRPRLSRALDFAVSSIFG